MRFGIIGFQHLHIDMILQGLHANPDLELVGIAESDPVLRARWATKLGVPAYTSPSSLISEQRIEAAVIVTAYAERAAAAIVCLKSGVHVLCDKPIATELAQVEALQQAYAASSAHFTCFLEKRFWGGYQIIKEYVAAGRLGEIRSAVSTGPHKLTPANRPAWMFHRETYGGILNDLAIHDLDAMLWLFGGRPTQLKAVTSRFPGNDMGDLEESGQIFLQTDRGLTAFIDVNWLTPEAAPWHGDYRLLVNGTRGAAAFRYVDHSLMLVTADGGNLDLPIPPDQNPLDDFAAALRAGRAPAISAADLFRATRLALLARNAADSPNDIDLSQW